MHKIAIALTLALGTHAAVAHDLIIHENNSQYFYEIPDHSMVMLDNSVTFPKVTYIQNDDQDREMIALVSGYLGAGCLGVYSVFHLVDDTLTIYQPYMNCAEEVKAEVRNGKFILTGGGVTESYPLSYIER